VQLISLLAQQGGSTKKGPLGSSHPQPRRDLLSWSRKASSQQLRVGHPRPLGTRPFLSLFSGLWGEESRAWVGVAETELQRTGAEVLGKRACGHWPCLSSIGQCSHSRYPFIRDEWIKTSFKSASANKGHGDFVRQLEVSRLLCGAGGVE